MRELFTIIHANVIFFFNTKINGAFFSFLLLYAYFSLCIYFDSSCAHFLFLFLNTAPRVFNSCFTIPSDFLLLFGWQSISRSNSTRILIEVMDQRPHLPFAFLIVILSTRAVSRNNCKTSRRVVIGASLAGVNKWYKINPRMFSARCS